MDTLRELDFAAPGLLAELERLSSDLDRFDDLPFGLVAMDRAGVVVAYNRTEAAFSGIPKHRVLGSNFFSDIAPCTNNYLVAGRFDMEPDLDETIDYVFTLRMRPTKVQLRMLKGERSAFQYLAVRRR